MNTVFTRIRNWYRALPEKKQYVEFVTAVLSVPVMLTVIILNLNNLTQQKNTAQKETTSGKVTPIQIVITGEKSYTLPIDTQPTNSPTPTSTSCIKEVGPVLILSPRENEVVTKDPVCITISTQSNYCPTVWSYRLNEGDWSDATDKNICLHNLTNGTKTIQFKIKSSSSNDEVTLQRSFVYQGNTEPTTEPTKASSSASLQ